MSMSCALDNSSFHPIPLVKCEYTHHYSGFTIRTFVYIMIFVRVLLSVLLYFNGLKKFSVFYSFNKITSPSPADVAYRLRHLKWQLRSVTDKQYGGVRTAPGICREVSPTETFSEDRRFKQGKKSVFTGMCLTQHVLDRPFDRYQ